MEIKKKISKFSRGEVLEEWKKLKQFGGWNIKSKLMELKDWKGLEDKGPIQAV